MKLRLREHRIDIEEVMLGTPKAPKGDNRMETILDQLRLRQIAKEQQATFEMDKAAATAKRALNEEMARADQQAEVTRSALAVTIAQNSGEAETAQRKQAAEGIRATAEAEAYAARVKAEAIGGTDNLIRQIVIQTLGEVIREAKMPLVPKVVVGSAGGEGASSAIGMLMALAGGQLDNGAARLPGLPGAE